MKAATVAAGPELLETSKSHKAIPKVGVSRVLSVLDFILRVVAALATLASAIIMGTSRQTLPFVARFVRFKANYKDLPTFTFFVIANSIVCLYLLLSLPMSIFHIIWSRAVKSRIILVIFDTTMLGLLTAGASSATAIVYLAHQGSTGANWFPFCRQFNNFCERISGSVIGSYVAVVVITLLIILSAIAISRRH